MKILFLGPECNHICNYLKSEGNTIVCTELALKPDSEQVKQSDFVISYGYRYIIKKDIIKQFHNKIINLHISLLPWNRGADPNLWSFLEDSPKGVTIHYIDEGIDTGDIIAQKEIFFDTGETLRSSYHILSREIQELFVQAWPNFIRNKIVPKAQPNNVGSFHSSGDKKKYEYLLTDGWDTPVGKLIGKALKDYE